MKRDTKNKKLLTLTVLSVLSSNAFAEPNVARRTLNATEVNSALTRMDANKVAELALSGKLGTCKAEFKGDQASHVFALHDQNGQEDIGENSLFPGLGRSFIPTPGGSPTSEATGISLATIPRSIRDDLPTIESLQPNVAFIQNSIISGARATAIAPSFASEFLGIRMGRIEARAKQELGSKVAEKVRNGLCGTINFEVRQVNFQELSAENVEFFQDDENKLYCRSTGFENDVYNPSTCKNEPVKTFLPEKACRFLYQVARSKGSVATQAMSTSSGSSSGAVVTGTLPTIKAITLEIKEDFVKQNIAKDAAKRDLISLASAVRDPIGDDYLPATTLNILKNRSYNLDKFMELDATVKHELANFHLTVQAHKDKSEIAPFSADLLAASEKIRTVVDAHILSNPNLQYKIHSVPKLESFRRDIALKLAPITFDIGLRPIRVSACQKLPPRRWLNPKILDIQVWNPSTSLINDLKNARFNTNLINQALVKEPALPLPVTSFVINPLQVQLINTLPTQGTLINQAPTNLNLAPTTSTNFDASRTINSIDSGNFNSNQTAPAINSRDLILDTGAMRVP